MQSYARGLWQQKYEAAMLATIELIEGAWSPAHTPWAKETLEVTSAVLDSTGRVASRSGCCRCGAGKWTQ